jgi:hypothetical protein
VWICPGSADSASVSNIAAQRGYGVRLERGS